MASRHALATSARCFNCQKQVLLSFISSLAPPVRQHVPQIQRQSRRAFTTSLRLRNDQNDLLTKDFPFEDAPEPAVKTNEADNVNEGDFQPWYLQVQEQKDLQKAPANPFAERQRLPELPSDPPPILESLLKYVSVDIGLDYLTLLDLRNMNPPPALGSNLLMIFGTARSERHLNVSADRLCRWLRTTYKLRPFADGLLGRNELKLKLRRKNRRSKMLGAAGATDPGSYDDGIHTGWICVNVGPVEGPIKGSEESSISDEDGIVGFGEEDNKPRIVVQILTEDKRGELELESLWKDAYDRAVRKEKAQREAAERDAVVEAESVETRQDVAGKVGFTPNVARPYMPRTAFPRQQVRQLHTLGNGRQPSNQVEIPDDNELEPQMLHQFDSRADSGKVFPVPPTYHPGKTISTQLDQCARALRTNVEYLGKLDKAAAMRALGSGEADRTSTAFLNNFYSNMPLFLEAPHWQSVVDLYRHAMAIGHQGYTRDGLVKVMRDMHGSIGVIPQSTMMDILASITRSNLVIYPENGHALNKPSTAEAALRQSLGLAFEVLEKMDAYGYSVVSDDIFLNLHYAISHPKIVIYDMLRLSDHRSEAPALDAPTNETVPGNDVDRADYTALSFKVQDRYNYKLRQAMKILRPGPLSNPMYNVLLETYGSQQHWKSFWNVWDDVPRNMASRTAEMYITLFRAVARAGHQVFAQKALKEAVPQMAQERPPIELQNDVAIAVGECIQVAQFDRREPFYVSLKRRLELALNDHLLKQRAEESFDKKMQEDNDGVVYGGSNEHAPDTVR